VSKVCTEQVLINIEFILLVCWGISLRRSKVLVERGGITEQSRQYRQRGKKKSKERNKQALETLVEDV
jgi:hypothetical protein